MRLAFPAGPYGTVFNEYLGTCDYKNNVICSTGDGYGGGDHHHEDHHHGEHHHHEEHHHEEHHHDHHHEEDSAQLPPSSAKKCSLERSDNNDSGECFLEPECETVCSATTNKVQGFVMAIFYQSNSKMVSFIAGSVSALPSAVSSVPYLLHLSLSNLLPTTGLVD